MILAFDIYIQDNKLLGGESGSTEKAVEEAQKWDVDIAYGYEAIELSAAETDPNVKTILSQIDSRYAPLVKNKILESIERLELKTGKLNYKILYLDPISHLTLKFIVYYDPILRKVLLLNTVNLPSSQQFQELSEAEKMTDPLVTEILKLLNNLHKEEMTDYKLQCVSRGLIENNVVEYHVTWSAHGLQYRSFVRSFSGSLQEISFGEIQTISLDHYRLDEF